MNSVRAVLNITSDKCYENREWVWDYRENDRLGGRDPYSNSDACAELMSSAFRDFFQPGCHRSILSNGWLRSAATRFVPTCSSARWATRAGTMSEPSATNGERAGSTGKARS